MKTIAETYQDELDAFEQRYFYQTPPDGFHKLLDAQGRPVAHGGFYCRRCKLQLYAPPSVVRHCGKVEKRPGWFRRLLFPTWKIKVQQ